MWAPEEVVVQCNTSWQTDEYIAHRIGLVPFRKVGNGTSMRLTVQGPCIAKASDLVGPGFEAVHPDIPILSLPMSDQKLDMTVRFAKHRASKHARYSKCCGVGMSSSHDGHHRISFDTIDGSPPLEALLEAIDAVDERVQNALLALSKQPERIPDSI